MRTATVNGTIRMYAYDHDGVRVSKTTGTGLVRTFLSDDMNSAGYGKPVEEKLGGMLGASYVLLLKVRPDYRDGRLSQPSGRGGRGPCYWFRTG